MHRLRKPWLALGWLWVAAIAYLSLTPHPPEPVRFWGVDKLEHVLAYGLLMLWFCQAYVRRTQRLFAAVLLAAMGVGLESLQGMTDYRSFEYADMLANVAGVMLGWVWARTAFGHVGRALEKRLFR